jgi:hypothetical protein
MKNAEGNWRYRKAHTRCLPNGKTSDVRDFHVFHLKNHDEDGEKRTTIAHLVQNAEQ